MLPVMESGVNGVPWNQRPATGYQQGPTRFQYPLHILRVSRIAIEGAARGRDDRRQSWR